MIKPAVAYKDKLNEVFQSVMLEPRMKWWHSEYPDSAIKVDDSFWDKIQMVSVGKEGRVAGYFMASWSRPSNFIDSLSCINFYPQSPVGFAFDLRRFMRYLAYEVKTPKIKWSVIVGNPIMDHYDRIVKKIGGRIVGTNYCDVLINNRYHNVKMYEWINYYHECTHCGTRVREEAEVMCWKCGLGEMVYYDPFR